MNTLEMVVVMQAALEGAKIEYREEDAFDENWKDYPGTPEWHWGSFEYRVKVEPTYKYINVYGNTKDHVQKGDLIMHNSEAEAERSRSPIAPDYLGTLKVEVK